MAWRSWAMVVVLSGMASHHLAQSPAAPVIGFDPEKSAVLTWKDGTISPPWPLSRRLRDQGCPPNNNVADWHDLTRPGTYAKSYRVKNTLPQERLASRHQGLMVAGFLRPMPADITQSRPFEKGRQLRAQQRAIVRGVNLCVPGRAIALEDELLQAIGPAIRGPVPDLEHNAPLVTVVENLQRRGARPLLHQRVIIAGAGHEQTARSQPGRHTAHPLLQIRIVQQVGQGVVARENHVEGIRNMLGQLAHIRDAERDGDAIRLGLAPGTFHGLGA